MLRALKSFVHFLFGRTLEFLSTRENVIIIQMYPKDRTLAVSYKKQVQTAQFGTNVIKNMMRGGIEFEKNSFEVFNAAAILLAQIIKKQ